MKRSPLAQSFVAAANAEARRNGRLPDMLILHYTGVPSAEESLAMLCSAESGVSCHYLVDEQGGIIQMVDDHLRAWHAGVSSWQGESDINSRSIGIEIQNPGHGDGYPDFPPRQMAAVAALCHDLIRRHAIPARHILAHSDVAPGRKIDPGEKFDWAYLAREGIGHWVAPAAITGGSFLQEGDQGQPVEALQAMLKLYGYGVELSGVYDARTRVVVEAFQRHFRPERVDGIADPSTVTTLYRLLEPAALA